MKILALSLFIALSIKAVKATEFTSVLSEGDRAEVLKLIDSACEEHWCEGRYDFKFKSLACDENSMSCRLRFKILDRGFIPGKFSEKYASCVFKNIKSAEQVLIDGQLTESFLSELDLCLTSAVE